MNPYQSFITITAAKSFLGPGRPDAIELAGGATCTYDDGEGNATNLTAPGIHPVTKCVNITAVTGSVLALFKHGRRACGTLTLDDGGFQFGAAWGVTGLAGVESGLLKLSAAGTAMQSGLNLVPGVTYEVSWEQSEVVAGTATAITASLGGGTASAAQSGVGVKKVQVVAGATNSDLVLTADAGTQVLGLDKMRVRPLN